MAMGNSKSVNYTLSKQGGKVKASAKGKELTGAGKNANGYGTRGGKNAK